MAEASYFGLYVVIRLKHYLYTCVHQSSKRCCCWSWPKQSRQINWWAEITLMHLALYCVCVFRQQSAPWYVDEREHTSNVCVLSLMFKDSGPADSLWMWMKQAASVVCLSVQSINPVFRDTHSPLLFPSRGCFLGTTTLYTVQWLCCCHGNRLIFSFFF